MNKIKNVFEVIDLKKTSIILKDSILSAIMLILCFAMCLFLQRQFDTITLIPATFVLGIFLISIITEGYIYGIVSSVISVFAVNFAFTFPYFKLNFTIPENLVSALIMIAITLITSALTTKLKRQELIKAESEREKTRANLLRAVSHDLRTPLTTIYSSCSVILESKDELTQQQRDKMLLSIKQDAEWLFRMVENLLSITKLGVENVKINKTPTVLDELVDSVLQKINKRFKNQAVEIEIPEDFVVIPMDAMLIEQVIINILENAMQHAVGMKKLSFRVFLISGKAIFEIKDDGCGIPKEKLKHIFTGFNISTDNSSDSKRNNAGIGLSVCATIIKAHDGDITAENIKEGGALFRFSLDTEESSDDK